MKESEESWFTFDERDSTTRSTIGVRGHERLQSNRKIAITQVILARTACVRRNLDGLFTAIDVWNVRKEHDYVSIRQRSVDGKIINNVSQRGWVDAAISLC